MDPIRQIRYLTPPIFLLLSLTLAARLDDDNALRALWDQVIASTGAQAATTAMVTLLLSAGAVLAAGVVIAAVSHIVLIALTGIPLLILWFLNRRRGAEKRLYLRWEVYQPGLYFQRIWPIWAPTMDLQKLSAWSRGYCAVVTFDHGYLWEDAKGVHEWLVRRWNWFNVNANSAVALGLSYVVGVGFLAIEPSPKWCRPVLVLIGVFIANAGIAWYQVQRMHKFQSYRLGPLNQRDALHGPPVDSSLL